MKTLIAVTTSLVIAVSALSTVQPAGIFTEGMVLQQGESVRVWGVADPMENIEVEFAGQRIAAQAGSDGKWMVTLEPIKVSSTPREMVFYSEGIRQLALGNVLVGEVWLAGGQSNMAGIMRSYRSSYQSVIDSANDPLLRMVTIPRLEFEGQNDDRPEWKSATPQNVVGFSATAYFFAKNLREKLDVPIGIVSCSVGATPAEAWMSRETLSSTPSLKRILNAYDAHVLERYPNIEEYLKAEEQREREMKMWNEQRISGAKPLPPRPLNLIGPGSFRRPCGLYETMLSQTIPYTVRGVIWYQGENNANAGAGLHYRDVFSTLIAEWRTEFMNPEMPFLFVQLATFGPERDTTAKWPELRDAQLWTEDNVENTGMVVLVDGGDIENIHPHSKDKVGYRLSLLARHMAYEETELVCRGPRVESVSRGNKQIELTFREIGSGLALKPVASTPFEICGKDGNYVPAKAMLVNSRIIVSAKGVDEPQHVRYGWRKWFEPTLFNKEGLPASPFKTDDFEPESKGRYYLDNL